MRKILFFIPVFLIGALVACNSDSGNAENSTLKAEADSLEKEVDNGHDAAMPKSMKIPAIQKEVQRLIDSIGKLPAKAQQAAAPYRAKLDTLMQELDYAGSAMDKWMSEYKHDSALNDLEQRIKYLTTEKLKVDKVKEAVLGSIQKADSLLKARF